MSESCNMLMMGGRRCEGLSGVTRVPIRRSSVWMDLLHRVETGTLGDCTRTAPGAESSLVRPAGLHGSRHFLKKRQLGEKRVREK